MYKGRLDLSSSGEMEKMKASENRAGVQAMETSNYIDEKIKELMETSSTDFDAWVSLIRETEQSSSKDIGSISLVYEKFLAEFPFCDEFWIKYISHKRNLCDSNEVVPVFERAVQALTFSVNIWANYCKFGTLYFQDPSDIRRLFERALSFVGKDYLCHEILDKYIEFEYTQKQWNILANIYINVLKFPTKKLHLYYDSFKKLGTLLEEEASLKGSKNLSEIQNKKDEIQIEISDISSMLNDFANSSDYKVTPDLMKKYLLAGEKLYEKSSEIEKKIICFEALIKRNYFDVKPLDDSELENWHKYLDFVDSQGDFDWSVKLYERCLIPCANYSEFWIRYIDFVSLKGGKEIANFALARSPTFFQKKIPSYRIYCAMSKEQMGDSLNARNLFLHDFGRFSSDFIKEINREANLVKRMGNIEAGCKIYEKAIESSIEKKNFEILPDLYTNFAQFNFAATGSTNAARHVFLNGIEQMPCKSIIKGLIQFEIIHGGADQIAKLDSIISNLIAPKSDSSVTLSYEDREEISLLLFEFVDLYGKIQEIRKMWARHCRLFPHKLRNIFPLNPNNNNNNNKKTNNSKNSNNSTSNKSNLEINTKEIEQISKLETNSDEQKDKIESVTSENVVFQNTETERNPNPNPALTLESVPYTNNTINNTKIPIENINKPDPKHSESDPGQNLPVSDPNPLKSPIDPIQSKSEMESGAKRLRSGNSKWDANPGNENPVSEINPRNEIPVLDPNPVKPTDSVQSQININNNLQQNTQIQTASSSHPYQNAQQYQMWQQYYQQQQMYYLQLQNQQSLSLEQQQQMIYYQQQQQMYQMYYQQQQQQWVQQQQQQQMAMNYGVAAQQIVAGQYATNQHGQETETPQNRDNSGSPYPSPAQVRTPSRY